MKKILVVDDDELMLSFIKDLLSKKGHQVVTAEDGLAALEILRTYTPDIIFFDLVMPNIDGKKLCRIIRGTKRLNNVYLVVISAILAEEFNDIAEMDVDTCIAKGSFSEMTQHILAVADQTDLLSQRPFPKEIIGMEEMLPRRSIQELLSVKKHFELILEGMSEGVLEITSEGRIVYANKRACFLAGISEEKLLGSKFIELFSEDDRQRANEFLKEEEAESKNLSERSPLSLGGYRVTLYAVPIKGEGQSKTVIVLSEEREDKGARERLNKTQEEMKKRVEERITEEIDGSHPARILVVDDEEMIRRTFSEILNFSGFEVDTAKDAFDAEKLCLIRSFDAIFADIIMPERNGIEFLEKIKETQPETPIIMFTGMPSVETAADAIRLGASDYLTKPLRHEVVVSAATRAVETKRLRQEKRRLEKENLAYQENLENLVEERTQGLRRQKELLENILESLTHPFYVVNANDYTIKIANSATKLEHSVTDGHACHLHSHNRNQSCDGTDYACPLEKAKNTKKPVRVEHMHVDSKGKVRTVEVHAYPLFGDSGNVNQVILYEIDISERKRLESVAEATNLMENIGYVFSGIRHEIGNPINSLKMTLSVLNKNLDSFEKETAREFTERSLNEVGRVEYLLRTLRNFSMFERPNLQNVKVESFMEKFHSLISKDLEKRGIEIKTLFSTSNIWARTDPRALQQVLLNLVTNAADACEDKEDSEIVIQILEKRGLITIAVKDNGCGMTEEQQRDLFKPFFTSKAKGTGLGLVIVKKMLSAMDSTIDIKSRENEGTTVTLFLPEGDIELE